YGLTTSSLPTHVASALTSSTWTSGSVPSFPTRRSSDLGEGPEVDQHADRDQEDRDQERAPEEVDPLHEEPAVGDEPVEREAGERSEEHTSELQSRENLVCRLLLEKKKPRRTGRDLRAGE